MMLYNNLNCSVGLDYIPVQAGTTTGDDNDNKYHTLIKTKAIHIYPRISRKESPISN
jgi:hypothetical protein